VDPAPHLVALLEPAPGGGEHDEHHQRGGGDGGGLGRRAVERRVEQRDLCGVHRDDAGEVQQDEHGGRDAEEAVHVEDVLDAERPRQ
jgi:hypothetical protein